MKRRVQFKKQIGVRTLLKGNQQSKSKQQPSNPSPTSREKLQSAAHRYDKKFQDLLEENNTKQRLGYKIIEDSDRPNKVTGRERSAISGMGYSRQFYGVAWSILEKKFGRPHVIIDAQLESIRKANQVKPQDATGLISFSVAFSIFSNLLKEYEQIGDLQSSSTLYMIVDKIPQIIKEKWWFYVDDKDEDWPDLIMFEKWLSRTAFLHEAFSVFKGERREEDRGDKRHK